jgi:hypothetical protein
MVSVTSLRRWFAIGAAPLVVLFCHPAHAGEGQWYGPVTDPAEAMRRGEFPEDRLRRLVAALGRRGVRVLYGDEGTAWIESHPSPRVRDAHGVFTAPRNGQQAVMAFRGRPHALTVYHELSHWMDYHFDIAPPGILSAQETRYIHELNTHNRLVANTRRWHQFAPADQEMQLEFFFEQAEAMVPGHRRLSALNPRVNATGNLPRTVWDISPSGPLIPAQLRFLFSPPTTVTAPAGGHSWFQFTGPGAQQVFDVTTTGTFPVTPAAAASHGGSQGAPRTGGNGRRTMRRAGGVLAMVAGTNTDVQAFIEQRPILSTTGEVVGWVFGSPIMAAQHGWLGDTPREAFEALGNGLRWNLDEGWVGTYETNAERDRRDPGRFLTIGDVELIHSGADARRLMGIQPAPPRGFWWAIGRALGLH